MNGRERLRQWIDRSKLDDYEAAHLIGLHPAQLSHILTGTRRPGLDVALRIERATGIHVEAWAPIERDTDADENHPVVATRRIGK
jgi:plasmid maintenance system antidote protein VapI